MISKRHTIDYYRKLARKYFDECDAANASCSDKKPIARPYTLSGLLCALELSRDAFHQLEKTREGKRFVEYALMKIEAFIEENALAGRISANAAQNSLKYSFGWNEKEKVQEDGKSITVSLSEEAKDLAK